MNNAVKEMLSRYECRSLHEYEQALREILQEIALVGLWRGKFFEHAAFYGGTALRIFYNLDRFSEDLDFTLLVPSARWRWAVYEDSILTELRSYGFDAAFVEKEKKLDEEKAQAEKTKERAKAEAERKEKERLAEILKNTITCPECGHKFQLKG